MADNYRTTLDTHRSPHEVYAAIRGVRDWWMADIQGSNDSVGEEFSYHVAGMHYCRMRVTELVEDRTIAWTVLDSEMTFVSDADEWVGTELRFELEPTATGTTVRFSHLGLTRTLECFDICSGAWKHYIGDSLSRYLSAGTGNPHSISAELHATPSDPRTSTSAARA